MKLPFQVQRSPLAYSVDLKTFGRGEISVLTRGKSNNEFTTLREIVTNAKLSDHKVYFVILRFTGIDVAGKINLTRGVCASKIVMNLPFLFWNQR